VIEVFKDDGLDHFMQIRFVRPQLASSPEKTGRVPE